MALKKVTDENTLQFLNDNSQNNLKRVTDKKTLQFLNTEQKTPKLKRVTDEETLRSLNQNDGAFKSFLKGFTRSYDEYASSVNKGLDKVADFLYGKDTHYFEDGIKYWNDKKRQNALETQEHPYANLAGQIILDPMNIVPGGIATKGAKATRIAKSVAGGFGVGYATTAFKNYGDDSKTQEQKEEERVLGGSIAGVVNGIIAGITKGRVKNIIPDNVSHEEAQKYIKAINDNPQEFGLTQEEAYSISSILDKENKNVPETEEVAIADSKQSDNQIEADSQMLKKDTKEQAQIFDEELQNNNNILKEFEELQQHPRFNELIDLRKDVSAKESNHPQRLVQQRHIDHFNNGNGYETKVSPAVYEKNYNADFLLTKQDIKKIKNGKIDDELLEKIKADLDTLDNHPDYAISEEELLARQNGKPKDMSLDEWREASTVFSNAGHNIAGGFGGGFINSVDAINNPQSADENGDGVLTGDELADKFLRGFMYGFLGTSAIKQLAKANPKVYSKVRQYIVDNYNPDGTPKQGIRVGAFDLENRYINKNNGRVLENELLKEAKPLSNPISSYQDFKKNFNWSYESDYYYIDTPIGQVRANPQKSFAHLTQNTHYQDRNYISGAFFETLKDPLFVVKKPYKNDFNIVFYKPFKDENGKYHLASFSVDNNGELVHKTFYEIDNLSKVRDLIKVPDSHLLYYKHSNQPTLKSPDYTERSKAPSKSAYNSDEIISQNNNSVKIGMFAGDTPKVRKTDNIEDKEGILNKAKNYYEKARNYANQNLEDLAQKEANKEFSDISTDSDSTFKNAINELKTLFTDTFSGEYHQARDKVHQGVLKEMDKIEKLSKALSKLSEQEDVELYRYLTKQSDGATLSDDIKKFGDTVRKTIDNLGYELVRNNIMTEEAYKEWVGVYLHREYEGKLNPTSFYKSSLKIDRIFQRGLNYTTKDVKKAIGWLEKNGIIDEIAPNVNTMKDLQKYLQDKGKLGRLGDGKVSFKELPNGKWEIRRDFTKAEREKMGEIESAKNAIPQTLFKLQRMLEHSKFLKEIEGVKGVVLPINEAKKFTKEELKKAGYVKLKGAEYGALSGRWVRKDVASDIGYTYKEITQARSDLYKTWSSYHSLWKKSKTVWNPSAHVNNFFGNWFLMHLAGVKSYKIPQMIKEGLDEINLYKKVEDLETKSIIDGLSAKEAKELNRLREQTKLVKEAKELGLFGRSQLNDILSGVEKEVGRKDGFLKKLDKKAEDWYQAEDNINRLSFYISLRKAGKNQKEAKQMVDYMLPDYTKPLPAGWRFARDYGIAPFISWSYYTLPKIVKMMGTKQGAKQVAKVLGTISIIEYVMSGGEITPLDNIFFVDTNKPEDFKGRRMVIGRDNNSFNTLKVDRLIPYAELQNPFNLAKSQFTGVPVNLANMLLSGNKLYNGRPITYKNKSFRDKAYDYAMYSVNQFAPLPVPATNAISFIDSLVRSKKRRKRSKVIEPRTALQELFKNVGANTISYNLQALKREQRQ